MYLTISLSPYKPSLLPFLEIISYVYNVLCILFYFFCQLPASCKPRKCKLCLCLHLGEDIGCCSWKLLLIKRVTQKRCYQTPDYYYFLQTSDQQGSPPALILIIYLVNEELKLSERPFKRFWKRETFKNRTKEDEDAAISIDVKKDWWTRPNKI